MKKTVSPAVMAMLNILSMTITVVSIMQTTLRAGGVA